MVPALGTQAFYTRPLDQMLPHGRGKADISHRVRRQGVTAMVAAATEGVQAWATVTVVKSRDFPSEGAPVMLVGSWNPRATVFGEVESSSSFPRAPPGASIQQLTLGQGCHSHVPDIN